MAQSTPTHPSLPAHLRLATTPEARPEAVITGPHWRITMLSSRLVRLEWSPDDEFEDRATQLVINRDLEVPAFSVERDGDGVLITTEHLRLSYDGQEFSPTGLRIELLGGISNYHSVWRPGVPPDPWEGEDSNPGGTARTLDGVDGRIALDPGLINHHGYAEVDDSATLALTDRGWVEPRRPGNRDLYVFAHGHDYAAAVREFTQIAGPQPMLPRYAFGNWWSRYHRYTDEEYRELIERFAAEDLPFSVAVIDMDWHWTEPDPRFGSGWTGYSWNTELFPDPPQFLAWLHEQGLRVTLNVHPADGIRAFEDRYPETARARGIDPASERPVLFDIADPTFVPPYLDLVHHPLEDEGVDFWWLDWQSGPYSTMAGLDPLWMLNHVHYLDSGRNGARPLTFSRYAGLGSHRYPIGFSGDTVISWESLDFQPEFTASAANVGYGWWSHDVGGHTWGVRDDELATRWVQLGCFSPINRLHSTNSAFASKEPWRFDAIAEATMGEFLRLRHRLVPYLYTMNERAHRLGEPLVRPIYWSDPARTEPYRHPNAAHFGTELIIAPITRPADRRTRLGRSTAWLPEGEWIDIFTTQRYTGGRVAAFHRPLAGYPVLARAGAIVPLTGEGEYGIENPGSLEILVFAGADGEFELYEDDDAAEPRAVRTRIAYDDGTGVVTVHRAVGDRSVLPAERDLVIRLIGVDRPRARKPAWDEATRTATVELPATPVGRTVRASFGTPRIAPPRHDEMIMELLQTSQVEMLTKQALQQLLVDHDQPLDRLAALEALELDPALFGALTEILTSR
ncbi:hypothetical protein GGQ54_000630 [Naumannella cuiyingiana]|uniref:Uncharacterized protein n=1 Tax=Naumannella cuiyingiana TaxID=1347891 RepID=A0A7Z0IJZ3_9ACTN|nr:glycoside hydrolase family 31 protein [Naumannella cuiyingiana]NYI70070.1 hypothetical protein [Naumannella cuiyingiana]